MANYYVACTQKVSYKYKASVRSNVTIFLLFGVFFSFLLPLILSYNSKGFWIKEFSYREQPAIKFKYEYLIIVEYIAANESLPGSIICTTNQAIINFVRSFTDHCSLFKVVEMDHNKDGKIDNLDMRIEMTNVTNLEIIAAHLFFIFDYKIFEECVMSVEIMTVSSHKFPRPIGKLDLMAGIATNMKKPLNCDRRHDKKQMNTSVIPELSSVFEKNHFIKHVFSQYSSRTINVDLANVYYTTKMKNEIAENEPFVITLAIRYDEQIITYRSKFWQLVKWAWIQYLSIMALFVFIFKKVKKFVFQNRILQTIKTCPTDDNDDKI